MKLYIKLIALAGLIAANVLDVRAQQQLSDPLNAVITNYLLVKNALGKNDAGKTAQSSKALNLSVSRFLKSTLKPADQAFVRKLEYDSRHISEVTDIVHQREHFISLSASLYYLVKDLKLNRMTLYRAYCTISKQYYITEKADAPDPYFATTKFSKVLETLPQNH